MEVVRAEGITGGGDKPRGSCLIPFEFLVGHQRLWPVPAPYRLSNVSHSTSLSARSAFNRKTPSRAPFPEPTLHRLFELPQITYRAFLKVNINCRRPSYILTGHHLSIGHHLLISRNGGFPPIKSGLTILTKDPTPKTFHGNQGIPCTLV